MRFYISCLALLASAQTITHGFYNNLVPKFSPRTTTVTYGFFDNFVSKFAPQTPKVNLIFQQTKGIEAKLLNLLENTEAVGGRGAKTSPETLINIESYINTLENTKSIPNPTDSPLLDGCWKLLYTSSPGTNSPIQKTFTSFDGVSVYQVVNNINTEGSFLPGLLPDVSNTVCFGSVGRLRVTALASTPSNRCIEPRKGDGKIFGFNIFGISSSREPRDPSERIDFSFQEARFEFKGLPFSIPYPVPFKLLGDEAKGWLDITYLSEDLRVARGNKGTIFVLKKSDPDDPLAAMATARDITKIPVISSNASDDIKVSTPIKQSKIVKRKPSDKDNSVVIIFPAQFGTKDDYSELSASITDNTDMKAYTTPLSRIDWPVGLLPSFFTKEYLSGNLEPSRTLSFYLKKVDEAVDIAMKENPDAEITLLAHSVGNIECVSMCI